MPVCRLLPYVVLAVSGIFQWIDQPTMIALLAGLFAITHRRTDTGCAVRA